MQMSSCCGKELGKIRGVQSNCNHQTFRESQRKFQKGHVSLSVYDVSDELVFQGLPKDRALQELFRTLPADSVPASESL